MKFNKYHLYQHFPKPTILAVQRKGNKDLIGVEIGVYKAENALWILKALPQLKKLYLIDPYASYSDYGQDSLDVAEKIAHSKLKAYKDKVVWLKLKSDDAIKLIKEAHKGIDFVYIDGDHQYQQVKKDIENYWAILKKGGIIGGDDIDNGYDPSHDGVMQAVQEFTRDKKLHICHGDWWVVK